MDKSLNNKTYNMDLQNRLILLDWVVVRFAFHMLEANKVSYYKIIIVWHHILV